MNDNWLYERDEDCDLILGRTAAMLAQRGDDQAVALLVDVKGMTIIETDLVLRTTQEYEPFLDRGITRTWYQRAAVLDVEEYMIPRFTSDITARILDVLTYIAERHQEPDVLELQTRPAVPAVDGDWRSTYQARLSQERPSNHARRETGRANHPVEDGLTFASNEEHRVYQVLKRLQQRLPEHDTIAIAPLPGMRLRAGHTWSPDMLVTGRGRVLILETDGPHHRTPRRYVDDRNRDLQWQRCGVPVVRLAVEDLRDDATLDARLHEEVMRHLRQV